MLDSLNTEENLKSRDNLDTLNRSQMNRKSEFVTLNNQDFSKTILEFKKELTQARRNTMRIEMNQEKMSKTENKPKRRSKSILDIDHILHNKLALNTNESNNTILSERSQNSSVGETGFNTGAKQSVINNAIVSAYPQKQNKEEEKNAAKKSIYSRAKENLSLHNYKIQTLIAQKKLNEDKSIQESKIKKPVLTEKIIKEKLKDSQPIYKRVDEIVKSKKNKIGRLQQNAMEKQKKEEEEIKPPVKKQVFNNEKFDSWIDNSKHWYESKNTKINRIKEEKLKKEEENLKNFHHPKIDKTSEDIVKRHLDRSSDKVYERLYQTATVYKNKLNKLKKDHTPEFTPYINRHMSARKSPPQNSVSINKITLPSKTNNLKKVSKKSTENIQKFDKDTLNLDTKEDENSNRSKLPEIWNNTDGNIEKEDLEEKENNWVNTLDSVNNAKRKSISLYDDLYKLNIRNTSAWDQNRENNVVFFDSKYNSIVSNFIEKEPVKKKDTRFSAFYNPFKF